MARRAPVGMGIDETAKYAAWQWAVSAGTVTPRFDFALPPLDTDIDVHFDLENDDPDMTLLMKQRWSTDGSLATEYGNRANLWMVYYRDTYPAALTNQFPTDQAGFGGDHVFAWGLINNWYATGDVQWLNAAKAIADKLFIQTGSPIPYSDAQYVPGGLGPPAAIVGDGTPRRFGRHLRLMAELSAAGAGATYTTNMKKLVAIAMEDPAYNATVGMWFASEGPTKSTLRHYFPLTDPEAQALYDGGTRYVSTFQQPLIIEGFRRVIESATFPITFSTFGPYTAQNLKDKVIAAAAYAYMYPLHPTFLYTGEVYFHGFDGVNASTDPAVIYDVWYGNHATTSTLHFTDGNSYTHDWINTLMLGAKYLHETAPSDSRIALWKDRAKLLWNRSSKSQRIDTNGGSGPGGAIVFGNGTTTLGDDRTALDTQIGRYVNATYDSSAHRYFANNRGELPYVDLLFATPSFGAGTWEEIPASSWIALAPPFDGTSAPTCIDGHAIGNQGPASFYANGGAAFDTTRGWYFIFGGGHANYSGTEVYIFIASTRQWLRLTDPHAAANTDANDPSPSKAGQPAARHTANSMCYMPNVDRIFVCGTGGTWHDGFAYLTAWHWNPNNYTAANNYGWTKKANPPVGTFTYNFVAYYPAFGAVVLVGRNSGDSSKDGIWLYFPDTDLYTQLLTSSTVWTSLGAMCLDTRRGHIYFAYPVQGGPVVMKRWDLAAIVADPGALATTNAPILINANPGLLYDETFDRVIAYNGYGQSLFVLDPDSLAWTTVTGTGAVPNNDIGIANFNPYVHTRFQRTATGTYLIHNWPTDNVFEYTPSSEDIIPPPPTPNDDADFAAFVTIPDQIQVGAAFAGSIQMTNAGLNTWDTTNYRLRSVLPPDNETFGVAQIALPSETAPTVTATFATTFTAPVAPGAYTFAWQMGKGTDQSGVTVTDNFNRANEANLTTSGYIAVAGQIGLTGNRAQSVTGGGAQMVYRHPTDLTTANAYAQALVDAAGSMSPTATCLIVRCNAAGTTFYMGQIRYDLPSGSVWRCVNGTYTQMTADVSIPGLVPGTPVLALLQASGTTISLTVNGSVIASPTDATITTGTFAGLRGFASTHALFWDDFEAGPVGMPAPVLFGDIAQKTITVTSGVVQQRLPFRRGWGHA